jgi:hypothetical protein
VNNSTDYYKMAFWVFFYDIRLQLCLQGEFVEFLLQCHGYIITVFHLTAPW